MNGELPFLMKDSSNIICARKGTGCLIAAICIFKEFGDTLFISDFEVNKNLRGQGIGTAVIEQLILMTGKKNIELDAKNDNAAKFWLSLGLKMIDNQHFYLQ